MSRIRPSQRMLDAIDLEGGVWKAARKWGVQYNSLRRFTKGLGGLQLHTAARIADRNCLLVNDLYDYIP